MILYSYFRSSASYRVRIALELKGVKPEETLYVNLREGEQRTERYLQTNPQGLVPALALEGGVVLTQSLAIIEYLDETYKKHPLLPEDPKARAYVRSIANAMCCEVQPLINLRVQQWLKKEHGADEAAIKKWLQHWFSTTFSAVEELLLRGGYASDYAYGNVMSVADCCIVPQMFSAERFGADTSAYPTLERIYQNALKHPAVQAAQPSAQPDFVDGV